jgi:hypothetical protein
MGQILYMMLAKLDLLQQIIVTNVINSCIIINIKLHIATTLHL